MPALNPAPGGALRAGVVIYINIWTRYGPEGSRSAGHFVHAWRFQPPYRGTQLECPAVEAAIARAKVTQQIHELRQSHYLLQSLAESNASNASNATLPHVSLLQRAESDVDEPSAASRKDSRRVHIAFVWHGDLEKAGSPQLAGTPA